VEVPQRVGAIPCGFTGTPEEEPCPSLCLFLCKWETLPDPPKAFLGRYAYPLSSLTRSGARVAVMVNPWTNLAQMAERIRQGHDALGEAIERVRAVIFYASDSGLVRPRGVALLGTSRHGWLALAGAAHIQEVGAAVATQTVSY